jgi:hypothetical protein
VLLGCLEGKKRGVVGAHLLSNSFLFSSSFAEYIVTLVEFFATHGALQWILSTILD